MAETLFDDWLDALNRLKESVEKDLAEIRASKLEIQQMKTDVFNRMDSGQYIRDERRLILSAPEIIIGDVDKQGNLNPVDASELIKGCSVVMQGVGSVYGDAGSIVQQATCIVQQAVDTGVDGKEAAVMPQSSIVQQAGSIVLQSNQAIADGATDGVFARDAVPMEKGVRIESDSSLVLRAAKENQTLKDRLDERIGALETQKGTLDGYIEERKSTLEDLFAQITEVIDKEDDKKKDLFDTRSNYAELAQYNREFNNLCFPMYTALQDYFSVLAEQAETNRQLTSLKAQKDAIGEEDAYKDETTSAEVRIDGECINLTTVDGEGNLRTNKEAGVKVRANRVDVVADDNDGSSLDKSIIRLSAHKIHARTNQTVLKDDKPGDFPGDGTFVVDSKTIVLRSVDKELQEEKIKEKALTEGGTIFLRSETVKVESTDTEGKATGRIALNAKAVEVGAQDTDKESHAPTGLAEGGTLTVTAETVKGGNDKSKTLEWQAEKIGLFATETAEIQQGEAKAVLQLDGGTFSASGDKTALYGETTLNGKTEVKDALSAPKITGDSIEAKSQFKSPNISDGMGVGGGGGGGSLSTKLQKAEAQEAGEDKAGWLDDELPGFDDAEMAEDGN